MTEAPTSPDRRDAKPDGSLEWGAAGCGMVLNPVVVTPDKRLLACCGPPSGNAPELSLGTVEDPVALASHLRAAQRSPLLRWLHGRGPASILSTLANGERRRLPLTSDFPCQSCALLLEDPGQRERLHRYLDDKGDQVLFDECLEGAVGPRQATGST